MVYGAVVFFYVWRFLMFRRPPSLGVALLPLGWILLALWDLRLVVPAESGIVRWGGVVIGVYLLTTAIRYDRLTPTGVKR